MTYEDILRTLAHQHPEVVVLTAENRAAIRTLDRSLGPRFRDFGICEQTMIGAAAGFALRGRIPVVHALATFLTMRAFEFIRTDIGIPHLPVKLIGAVPGFLSEANGPTHQAIEDIAIMRTIPGMRIFCPSDTRELLDGLPHIIADPHPWYVRFTTLPPSVPQNTRFSIGSAAVLRPGSDATLLTYGTLAGETLRAAGILAEGGHDIRVLSMRTLRPVDEEAIRRAADETGALITIEDHRGTGGLSTIVAGVLASRPAHAPLASIDLEDRWFVPALLPDILDHEGFTAAALASRVAALLAQLDGSDEIHAKRSIALKRLP